MIHTRPTLSQISKALDLSISTISKSLSDSPEISISTKQKVQEFARKCNYRPNSFAASLRRGYTKNIGLIIPSVLNPFYAKVLVGIEKYLDENDYKLFTSISNESAEKESHYLSLKMLGMHGSVRANQAIQNADCIICVGARFDDRTVGNVSKYAPNAKHIIHINSNKNVFNKMISNSINIHGLCEKFYQNY